jgi:molybdopterin synthase sulfur carrier subunit
LLSLNYLGRYSIGERPLTIVVSIPAALRQYTHDSSEVNVDASTVGEVLLKLDGLFPGLKAFILDESQEVRRYVNIFVNKEDVRSGAGLMTKLKDGDHLLIVPAIAGGS